MAASGGHPPDFVDPDIRRNRSDRVLIVRVIEPPLLDRQSGDMKILILDDHPLLRQGLAMLLAGSGDTVLEAGTVEQATDLIDAHPDLELVVLDLFLPGEVGWTLITTIGETHPGLPIVVLSSSENPKDVRRALQLGALGYIPKSAGPHTFLSAIRLVLSGELYVPPLLLDATMSPPAPSPASTPRTATGLTDRQTDILRLLAEGIPNKVIARQLDLSEKTVKAHVTAIFRALDVVNRTQAANAGRAAGLI